MSTAKVDSIELYYEEKGSGEYKGRAHRASVLLPRWER